MSDAVIDNNVDVKFLVLLGRKLERLIDPIAIDLQRKILRLDFPVAIPK